MIATGLRAANLDRLGGNVAIPSYDRDRISVGIVHFGVGGFHRSHQAMYLDALMDAGHAMDWGICGVGVLPADAELLGALADQDHLYTLLTRAPDGTARARVIGSIVRTIHAPHDSAAVLDVLVDERTRIVSLTITEGGYNLDPVTGRFDEANPDVLADANRGSAAPSTVFGYVIEALRRRRAAGIPAFTVLSCDNVQSNGRAARDAFAGFAALVDPELEQWVREEVCFPNCMVDRITPTTTTEDVDDMRAAFGIDDRCPAVCEPFVQWVVEDSFGAGRPPLERVGVRFVDDVRPYELMKLRLLNAGHQALAYAGHLCGYVYAHEAAQDPVFVDFLTGYMTAEAAPTLGELPGVDLPAYIRTLLERFANPAIKDTIARLCAASSDRIPKFVLPVIRANLAMSREIVRATAIVACWARYAEGVDEQGRAIDVQDPLAAELIARARRQRAEPLAFVQYEPLFGDLAADRAFADRYLQLLGLLHDVGARRTLAAINGERLSGDGPTGRRTAQARSPA